MPARPNVPGVVQIVIQQVVGADTDVINRFYQKYTGTPGSLSDAGAAAWAAAIGPAWAAHLAPFHSTDMHLESITVTDLSSDVGGFGVFDSTAAGTDSSPPIGAGSAAVIKQHIERRYRGGHPRQYLGGMASDNLDSVQSWLAAFVANLATAYIAFRNAAAAGCPTAIGPATDVNVSFYQGFTNHTYPSGRVRPIPNLRVTPVVDQISTFSVNPTVASQRRRNLQSR